jgi:signal transduction histidine kinase
VLWREDWVAQAMLPDSDRFEPGEELRSLSDAIPSGVAICRLGVVVWASPRLAELLGRQGGVGIVGERPEELLLDLGDGWPPANSQRDVLCGVRGLEETGRRVRIRRHAPLADDGQAEIWIFADETRQVRAEAELMRHAQRLHEANRERVALREELCRQADEREELLGIVSHELRTPLTVISGYTKLLLSGEVGPLDETQRRYLKESARGCRQLDAFIASLLESVCAGAVEDSLDLRDAALEPVVLGIGRLLGPLLGERELGLEIDLAPDAQVARFDPTRVEQVLTNLVGNAIKYTKRGGVIRLRSDRLVAAGRHYVQISVADQGPGIAHTDRTRIFEPWVRATEPGAAAGLGLGLSICKRIVEAHGGCISVHDEPGGGSRFVFTLPAQAGAEAGEES